MKKTLFAFAFAVTAALTGCFSTNTSKEVTPEETEAQVSASSNIIRIAAWNMKWFPSGYPIKEGSKPNVKNEFNRIDSAARFIVRETPDIVMFEEMRDQATCIKILEQMEVEGWKVNACSEFPKVPELEIPTHQNAIISHYDAVDAGFREWQFCPTNKFGAVTANKAEIAGGIRPPRGFVYAVLDIDGRLVAVFGVHLKSNYISDDVEDKAAQAKVNTLMREVSANQLVAAIKEFSEKDYNGRKISDVFVGGDFNTSIFAKDYAGEKTINTFKTAGFRDCFDGLTEEERYTMPESKHYPPTVFDYLLHRGPAKTSDPKVAIRSWTSDHQMLSVAVELR